MADRLDKIDKMILDILKADSRTHLTAIGRRLGIPDTSVHFRFKRLINTGVIKKFTIEIGDYNNDGFDDLSTDQLINLIEAHESSAKEFRKETDLLWDGLRMSLHRLERLEQKVKKK